MTLHQIFSSEELRQRRHSNCWKLGEPSGPQYQVLLSRSRRNTRKRATWGSYYAGEAIIVRRSGRGPKQPATPNVKEWLVPKAHPRLEVEDVCKHPRGLPFP